MINGSFTSIEYRKDIDTFKKQITDKLELNDIGKCSLKLDRKIAIDAYTQNRYTGSFIIIDKYTNNTIGAGMIISSTEKESSNNQNLKDYSQSEKELNAFIRRNYPDWTCKNVT